MALTSSYGKRPALVTSPVPIGVPFPYPIDQQIPLGFLNCSIAEGTTFASDVYADLYEFLGNTNILPYFPATSTHIHIIKAKEAVENVEALKSFQAVYVPTMPVGIPFPWVSGQTYPAGTMLCNGQSFDVNEYPELALVYPSGVLPDLRGVALRGRDAGKGLDVDGASRIVGSYQADELKSHNHSVTMNNAGNYAGNYFGATPSAGVTATTNSTGGTETRMKNIAVDWLVYVRTISYDLTINNGNAVTLGGYAPSYFTPLANIPTLIKQNMNADGLAPMGACRAWVNFNGQNTVTINSSMNVSSITDNGTADYTINFTTPMPDINYTVIATSGRGLDGAMEIAFRNTARTQTISTCHIANAAHSGSTNYIEDTATMNVAIFR